MKKILGIIFLGLLLSGNAYGIIKGAGWEILNIVSTPTNAECKLTNNKGSWLVVTPQEIKIKRSKKKLKITCNKIGYNESTTYYPLRDLKKEKMDVNDAVDGTFSAVIGDPVNAVLSGLNIGLTKTKHKFGTYATRIINDNRFIEIVLQKKN